MRYINSGNTLSLNVSAQVFISNHISKSGIHTHIFESFSYSCHAGTILSKTDQSS